MKIKISFNNKINTLDYILKDFPFETVVSIMDTLNWTYYSSNVTPDISLLKSFLTSLFNSMGESISTSSGGFTIMKNNIGYTVSFDVAAWFFDSKSSDWDYTDTSFFNQFIDKCYKIFNLLNHPFAMYTKEELKNRIMKECDFFTGNNLNEHSIPNFGLYFSREYHDDNGTSFCYELVYKAIERVYD